VKAYFSDDNDINLKTVFAELQSKINCGVDFCFISLDCEGVDFYFISLDCEEVKISASSFWIASSVWIAKKQISI
jgi:hypothetical protein